MQVSIYVGDIADAPAEAICTSTNPRLSLMMGTGASVRERGGFEVLRACEAIVDARGHLPAGSVHVTTAGRLPHKAAIHCVASDRTHLTSVPIIHACVKNALAKADAAGWKTVAMPVFGSGHARLKFDRAIAAMGEALRDARTAVERVVVVVYEERRAADAARLIEETRCCPSPAPTQRP